MRRGKTGFPKQNTPLLSNYFIHFTARITPGFPQTSGSGNGNENEETITLVRRFIHYFCQTLHLSDEKTKKPNL